MATWETSKKHILGNAEAVLVMVDEILKRHGHLLDKSEKDCVLGAWESLRKFTMGGAVHEIVARSEEWDQVWERLAEIIRIKSGSYSP